MFEMYLSCRTGKKERQKKNISSDNQKIMEGD